MRRLHRYLLLLACRSASSTFTACTVGDDSSTHLLLLLYIRDSTLDAP
ncbi:TPA: hypothetical protein ACW59Z_003170 [Legionella pneumophila]